jgi:hypothetical protein
VGSEAPEHRERLRVPLRVAVYRPLLQTPTLGFDRRDASPPLKANLQVSRRRNGERVQDGDEHRKAILGSLPRLVRENIHIPVLDPTHAPDRRPWKGS